MKRARATFGKFRLLDWILCIGVCACLVVMLVLLARPADAAVCEVGDVLKASNTARFYFNKSTSGTSYVQFASTPVGNRTLTVPGDVDSQVPSVGSQAAGICTSAMSGFNASGEFGFYKNTTTGQLYICYNDGGTIKVVELAAP